MSKALAMYNQGPAGDLGKAQDYVAKVGVIIKVRVGGRLLPVYVTYIGPVVV